MNYRNGKPYRNAAAYTGGARFRIVRGVRPPSARSTPKIAGNQSNPKTK